MIDLVDCSYEKVIEKALLLLPDKIKKLTARKEYTIDDMGKSGSKVLILTKSPLRESALSFFANDGFVSENQLF